jgi:hypothetical protein
MKGLQAMIALGAPRDDLSPGGGEPPLDQFEMLQIARVVEVMAAASIDDLGGDAKVVQ